MYNFFWVLQRAQDLLYVSSDIRTPEAAEFLRITEPLEMACNAITAVIAPDLYISAKEAIRLLKQGVGLHTLLDCVGSWFSVWSGMSLIVNRSTPLHRDPGAASSMYDLLVSGGTHTQCTLDVPDIGASFSYLPGTTIGICGRVLRHKVDSWEGGERICAAHFIKDAVHGRLNQIRPPWPRLPDYLALSK